MAKKSLDKRAWVNIAAGTVAVIAIVFGVKQCSDKQEANQLNKEAGEVLAQIDNSLNIAQTRIGELEREADALDQETIALRDTITVRDSTIAKLSDSLAVVNKNLDDCKKGKVKKDCGCRSNKKPVVAKKVVAPKPETTKSEPVVADVQEQVVVVTPDTVMVRNNTVQPSQTVVVNGNNNGTIVVNSNGNVCTSNIVNEDNSAELALKQQDLLRQYASSKVKGNRKVRCR